MGESCATDSRLVSPAIHARYVKSWRGRLAVRLRTTRIVESCAEKPRGLGLSRLCWFLLLIVLSGCATFRDIRKDLANSGLRRGNKDSWRSSDPDDLAGLADRRPGRLISRDFNPRNLPTTIKVITAWGENQKGAQAAYDRGMQLYESAIELRTAEDYTAAANEFHRAANKFREACAAWPDSALEQDALFMQAEAFFFADQYVLANRAYESLAAQFSGTRYMDHLNARRFMIAQFWLETKDAGGVKPWFNATDQMLPTTNLAGEARRIFHRIRLDDPTGKLADDATVALGKAFYKAERWTESADAFEDLRKSYPGSKFQFEAHLLELNARLASYAGPDYDATPLRQADDLLQAIVRQFPNEIQQNREYLTSQASRVQTMLAAHDYKTAKFYEGRGENLAASLYYDAIAKRYSNTPVADEATEKVADLKDKPPEPVQPAGWFVELFPEPRASKPLIANGNNGTVFK